MYEKNSDINRRVFFIGGGMVLLSSLLLSRLWNLQIKQKDKFSLLSDKNRIRLIPVFPERGNFLDRNGKELAINSSNFKLSFVPGDLLSEKQLIEKISS
ncbi:MAG: penicillin-binding protein, partial [Pseudomonadota bacterium]|nr:penicillin-binding protein [Pseudomonadota bacterium]